MLEKINRTQWGKLMHHTYTFTPASSNQRIHPASKVIVEPILWFSIWPVHSSLSHVWQSIPEYGSLFSQMPYPCSFSLYVVLDMLYPPPNSFKFVSHVQLFSQFWIFPWQMYLGCLNVSPQSHFYPLPFFAWTGDVSKWWTVSISYIFQKYLSFTHWLITSFFMRT